jgi:hypothetical protein
MGHPASSRRLPVARDAAAGAATGTSPTMRPRGTNSEWKGNLALILAIAALVGVATFVIVREKIEEMRRDEAPRPASGSTSGAPTEGSPAP